MDESVKLSLIFGALALSACSKPIYPQYETDQQLRHQIFMRCLSAIPKGPERTVYNDWAEVVGECESASYRQAQRCVVNCPNFEKDQPQ